MQASQKKSQENDLREFYTEVRDYTERLCRPLEIEDYIPQPVADVSPPKWNIAHTTWFFEEMILKKYVPGYKVFDEQFGYLFNSYYNSVGKRTARDHRGALSRPTVKEVFAYRKYVDKHMDALLSEPPAVAGGLTRVDKTRTVQNQRDVTEPNLQPPAIAGGSDLIDLVTLGFNHEQQHQELLLTDLKYTFSTSPLFPVYRDDYAPEEIVSASSMPPANAGASHIAAGVYEIGFAGDGFCFDNELARHKVWLDDFTISNRLVTNAEFIEFIKAGGYRDHRLWHSEGWDWVNQNGVESPLYWQIGNAECGVRSAESADANANEWYHFTLGGLRKLPLDAPVCHVSFYEAAAFAEWKGMRLPTEAEWETANEKFDWGLRWEWTSSAYLPYPGFAKAAGAVGEYNGKFMINQMVLRGSSAITPRGHSRPTYRNFFHPHLRWQFTGIRLARSEPPA